MGVGSDVVRGGEYRLSKTPSWDFRGKEPKLTGPEAHGMVVGRERGLTPPAYALFCPSFPTSQQVKDGSEIPFRWEFYNVAYVGRCRIDRKSAHRPQVVCNSGQ